MYHTKVLMWKREHIIDSHVRRPRTLSLREQLAPCPPYPGSPLRGPESAEAFLGSP